MTDVRRPGHSLSSNRAFVVQFRAPQEASSLPIEGRIEHLVSGQTAPFTSWPELTAFITQVPMT